MEVNVIDYVAGISVDVHSMFMELRDMLLSHGTEEKMWAKLPSYYKGNSFVRLIPFKDHINIEAVGISSYLNELSAYKTTSKGMLQIYVNQDIPKETLEKIFRITLNQGERI